MLEFASFRDKRGESRCKNQGFQHEEIAIKPSDHEVKPNFVCFLTFV